MQAVVDTSALVDFFRGQAQARRLVHELDRLVVPPAALGELFAGALRSIRRPRELQSIRTFLDSDRVAIPPCTQETSERWATIKDGLRRAGHHVPINDVWIAACAMELGLPVITADRHFLDIPQVIVRLIDHA